MRRVVVTFASVVCGLSQALSLDGEGGDAPVPSRDGIAATFRTKCASCHTVPDPARESDRAWLDQVNRTA